MQCKVDHVVAAGRQSIYVVTAVCLWPCDWGRQTVSCELPVWSLQCDSDHIIGADRQSPVNYLCCHCSVTDHIIGADRQSPVNYLRCHCSVTDHIIGADRQSSVNYLHCHCSVTDHIIGADRQSPELPVLWLQHDWPHNWGRHAVHCEVPVLGQTLCSICDCNMTAHMVGADRQSTVN